jgi:hypothetical protein
MDSIRLLGGLYHVTSHLPDCAPSQNGWPCLPPSCALRHTSFCSCPPYFSTEAFPILVGPAGSRVAARCEARSATPSALVCAVWYVWALLVGVHSLSAGLQQQPPAFRCGCQFYRVLRDAWLVVSWLVSVGSPVCTLAQRQLTYGRYLQRILALSAPRCGGPRSASWRLALARDGMSPFACLSDLSSGGTRRRRGNALPQRASTPYRINHWPEGQGPGAAARRLRSWVCGPVNGYCV